MRESIQIAERTLPPSRSLTPSGTLGNRGGRHTFPNTGGRRTLSLSASQLKGD